MYLRKTFQKAFGGLTLKRKKGLIGLAVVVVIFSLSIALNMAGPGDPRNNVENHTEDMSSESTIWTCSMHPQIKLPNEGKCPICFMDLIPLELGIGDDTEPRQLRMSETAVQLAQIQTTQAIRAIAEVEIRMVGNITYDESRIALIAAWVGGRLDRLHADFTGATVNKGDPLVDMYSPELLAVQEELLQARKSVKSLDQTTSRVLKSTAAATLDAVRNKIRLLGFSPEQIKTIEASAEASDHLTIYSPIGGIVIDKGAKEGMYVSTGTRIYTIADLTTVWATFEAYESDLPWLRYGQRAEFTVPSLPGEHFDAIISFIDPFVNPATRTVTVRAVVDNVDGRLKPDMFVRGLVKSRLNNNGDIIDEHLAGKWISPVHPEIVKNGPGTCDVCGRELVPAASLGYATETTGTGNLPVLIPATAPLITGKRAVVYVASAGGDEPSFTGREIELGPRAGNFYVVKTGIEDGEAVVSAGAFKIDSELQIQAKPSMMSPGGDGVTTGHQSHQSTDHSSSKTDSPGESKKLEAGEKALQALTPVYSSYFDVQMALAKDDFKLALSAGAKLKKTIEEVDMSVFSHKGHDIWMGLSKEMIEQSRVLTDSESIDAARKAFFHLSVAVIDLHKTFGHIGEQNYYLTHCPMARDGKGAFWLQKEDKVWNSMYGKMMLRCGTIEKKLEPWADPQDAKKE